ncbi:MAG: TetR family transcriptional regulator C-terminal domain-containing protein [Candidatus Delongbacteria bacterium]
MSRTAHNPEATRRALLESAATQIHRLGFQATSLDAILAETGVSKGALYHHFATKHDLGLAVVDEVYRTPFLDEWRAGLSQGGDPLTDLLVLLRRKRDQASLCTVQHGCPLNNLAQELAGLDEEFRRRIEAVMRDWRLLIQDALERARLAGLLRPGVDPAREAAFVVAVVEGATGTAKTAQDPQLFADTLATLEEHLLALRLRSA